jgi:hydroxyacylglutathione hydrolase
LELIDQLLVLRSIDLERLPQATAAHAGFEEPLSKHVVEHGARRDLVADHVWKREHQVGERTASRDLAGSDGGLDYERQLSHGVGTIRLRAVIIERSMQDEWLSNTYLVGDEEGGVGVVIDAGGPCAPLVEAAGRLGLDVRMLLLTHHHHDHVAEASAWEGVEVVAHPDEARLLDGVDRTIEAGETLEVGGLRIETLHTPGHTAGMLNFVVNGGDVFTGDTLFKGSVGGVRAPGSTGFEDLRHSIMDVLMGLPHETRVHPGHTDPTTIGDEWERNAFIRLWRGLDDEGSEPCEVEGEEATLVLWAPDYDGGHKAWVRWPDGKDDIVPGSRVSRG